MRFPNTFLPALPSCPHAFGLLVLKSLRTACDGGGLQWKLTAVQGPWHPVEDTATPARYWRCSLPQAPTWSPGQTFPTCRSPQVTKGLGVRALLPSAQGGGSVGPYDTLKGK